MRSSLTSAVALGRGGCIATGANVRLERSAVKLIVIAAVAPEKKGLTVS
jgi:hypothetical protein